MCALEYKIPEVVATQLWLAPLFGTPCGMAARATPERANTNIVTIVIAVPALRLFVKAMSLLVTAA